MNRRGWRAGASPNLTPWPEVKAEVETKAEKAREDFEKRWNFTLVEDKPIEGRIQWETLKARKNQGSPTSTSNSAGAGQTRTAER